jgi:predicted nucleic acid-binding protein
MAIYLRDTFVVIDALNRRRGRPLSAPDVVIAAPVHMFVLMTDNRKDFPMPQLALYALPGFP